MGRKIPDRWINYKAMGKLIDNTPFVPFKVPLHDVSIQLMSFLSFAKNRDRRVNHAIFSLEGI